MYPERPVKAVGWTLRTRMAQRRDVRLVLSSRCDNVHLNAEGLRVLQGRITRVAPTDAYCIIVGRHVPLTEIDSVVDPHHSQALPSDPAEVVRTES